MLDEILKESSSNYLNPSLNKQESQNKSSIKSKDQNKDSFLNEDFALSNKSKVNDIMKKYCTLYDEKESIKPLNINYLNKKRRKEENANSTGPMWFNMKAPEMTPELKNELKALNLKKYIDPTQFHKKSDKKVYEKYFQIGTIKDNILDGKKNRLKKSEVTNTILEDVLNRDIANGYSLKKFEEYQTQRRKIGLKKSKLNKYKLKTKGKNKDVVTK